MIRLAFQVSLMLMVAVLAAWSANNASGVYDEIRNAPLLYESHVDTPEGAPRSRAAKVVAMASLDRFPDTTGRPVFFEGRQYPKRQQQVTAERKVEPVRPKPAEINDTWLRGVAVIRGIGRALIEDKSKLQRWIREGELFNGWTIVTIDEGSVKMRNGDQVASLQLYTNERQAAIKSNQALVNTVR